MKYNFWQENLLGVPALIIGLLAVVDIVLKGMALWKSARRGQQFWFIALLLINSLGILPLIYLLFFDKGTSAKKGKKR